MRDPLCRHKKERPSLLFPPFSLPPPYTQGFAKKKRTFMQKEGRGKGKSKVGVENFFVFFSLSLYLFSPPSLPPSFLSNASLPLFRSGKNELRKEGVAVLYSWAFSAFAPFHHSPSSSSFRLLAFSSLLFSPYFVLYMQEFPSPPFPNTTTTTTARSFCSSAVFFCLSLCEFAHGLGDDLQTASPALLPPLPLASGWLGRRNEGELESLDTGRLWANTGWTKGRRCLLSVTHTREVTDEDFFLHMTAQTCPKKGTNYIIIY